MIPNINTIGFIFNKAKTIVKYDYKNKYNTSICNIDTNTFESYALIKSTYQKNCCCCSNCIVSGDNYKICIFKLCKEELLSSTLGIATNFNEAWLNFYNGILNLLNAYFVISVTKCEILHSFNAKLIRVKYCDDCNVVILYFKYNFIPFTNNLNPDLDENNISNSNNNLLIPNNQASSCGSLIKLNSCSNVPTEQTCYPSNYWPTNEVDNKTSVNKVSNFSYNNLTSTTYHNLKFYYNDKYVDNICFSKKCC